MTALNLFLWILLGIAVQLALFLGLGFRKHWQNYRSLRDADLPLSTPGETPATAASAGLGWSGYQSFTVSARVLEDDAAQVCSFYLTPQDGAPLPPFFPGQFLTFRLELPKADGTGVEHLVRCYSLSGKPHPGQYRVSIKRVPAPATGAHPPGRSSNFFHDHVPVGAVLQVRAPSGHFYLDAGVGPVVLIAGGIGITPLLSMLEWCVAQPGKREVWLFYGVRNGREAAFAPHLRELAKQRPNIHVNLCLSNPLAEDQKGVNHEHQGRVDVALLRAALPLKPFHYYICGPGPMMETLVPALQEWGVPDSRIHYEAFGPATVNRSKVASSAAAPAPAVEVTFAKSGKRVLWNAGSGSLLEFAEAHGVAIDSGCRAGGCGTCQTVIRTGEVSYLQTPDHDPAPGSCLMCVCVPRTAVTLEA